MNFLILNTEKMTLPISKLIDIFLGNYKSSNIEITNLKKDILNVSDPGDYITDKTNMSNDMRNISNDFKKAVIEYKDLDNS